MRRIQNCGDGVTLTLLANYVDPEFLDGKLHHEGGVVLVLARPGITLADRLAAEEECRQGRKRKTNYYSCLVFDLVSRALRCES